MTVRELLDAQRPVLSFEYFPPKTDKGEEALFETIRTMKDLEPGFVSITCGTGGSTRTKTLDWANKIKSEIGIEVVVHMTCLGRSPDELRGEIARARDAGIENLLALRGDGAPPLEAGVCKFAIDLIKVIRESYPGSCVLGACYPEGHVDAESRELDLQRLKDKCDAGIDVLVTQLFFDNSHYFSFIESARRMGISQPIVPGIMPITDLQQVSRFTQMCGATIPPALLERLQQFDGDKEATLRVGVDHATEQCRALIAGGAPGIHFYTLNKSPATRMVVAALR